MPATAYFRAKAEFQPNGSPIHNGLTTPSQIPGAQPGPQRDEFIPLLWDSERQARISSTVTPLVRESSRGSPEWRAEVSPSTGRRVGG